MQLFKIISLNFGVRMSDKEIFEMNYIDTVYVQNIESKVFQAIVYQSLKEIDSIELIEGNLFDSLIGGEGNEKMKGIHVEQDEASHTVSFKIDLNVSYGVCIPSKAQEIQKKIKEDVSKLTGLHIGYVHVVFKNVILPENLNKLIEQASEEPILYTEEK